MSKIMSYNEYLDSEVPEGTATIKLEGTDLVFQYNDKTQTLSLTELEDADESEVGNRVRETFKMIGANKVQALDEIISMILSPGTDGTVDPKRGFIANTLNVLFRKQTSHKSVWDVIMGAEDSGNRIRN